MIGLGLGSGAIQAENLLPVLKELRLILSKFHPNNVSRLLQHTRDIVWTLFFVPVNVQM